MLDFANTRGKLFSEPFRFNYNEQIFNGKFQARTEYGMDDSKQFALNVINFFKCFVLYCLCTKLASVFSILATPVFATHTLF